jgi:phosphoribosylformimino-5-aminoimidazole carboxamide ribotide isomerase
MVVIPALRAVPQTTPIDGAWADARDAIGEWSALGFRQLYLRRRAPETAGHDGPHLSEIARDLSSEIWIDSGEESEHEIRELRLDGASKVIVRGRALDEPQWLETVANEFPGSIVVDVQTRDRRVIGRGWGRSTSEDVLGVIEEFGDVPLGGLLLGLRERDGALNNTLLGWIEELVEAAPYPVMIATAIESVDQLRALEHRQLSAIAVDAEQLVALGARAIAAEFSA